VARSGVSLAALPRRHAPYPLLVIVPVATKPSENLDAAAQAALAAIRVRNPKADPLARIPDVHPAKLPRHVAIIMDGNGRWAEQRGFPRAFGHRNGVSSVRAVVEEIQRLGIECVTLYSFSQENWKRPADEVAALMQLCEAYVSGERGRMMDEGLRFRVIGRRAGLPAEVIEAIELTEHLTRENKAGTLCLALNYSARAELADAARALAIDVAAGRVDPASIDERALAEKLYAPDLPEVDLLIRTAGELRISNFLLWQISYAELFVTETLWPDFNEASLHEALRAYAKRERRFGGLSSV
jgi:undecaprenyl diphosphate synthase